jgi:NinB protein
MPKQVFYLTTPTARATVKQAIDCAPDNYRVEIRERTRTLDQNAALWRLLTILSKRLSWTVNGRQEYITPDDWKDILTASLHQEQRIAMGARGGFVMLGRKTSTMPVKQMSELIEFVTMFCAENGIDVDN